MLLSLVDGEFLEPLPLRILCARMHLSLSCLIFCSWYVPSCHPPRQGRFQLRFVSHPLRPFTRIPLPPPETVSTPRFHGLSFDRPSLGPPDLVCWFSFELTSWWTGLASQIPTCRTSKARARARSCRAETIVPRRKESTREEVQFPRTSEGVLRTKERRNARTSKQATLNWLARLPSTCRASACVARNLGEEKSGIWKGKQKNNKEMDQGTRRPPIRHLARWSSTYPTTAWRKRSASARLER